MKLRTCTSICVAAAALGLAGCETTPPYSSYPTATYPAYPAYPGVSQYPAAYPVGYNFGYVESVEVLPVGATSSTGLPGGIGVGAIGGAIAGGVLGNQIGHGGGRAAATVGGAVAGGVIGNEIEKRVTNRSAAAGTVYRFRVRMDDGSYQTVTQEDHQNIRVGDRVRIDNGRVFAS
jgi:outer membrane lipoprotein SlyB